MNWLPFLPVENAVQQILTIVLALLVFFTALFSIWKLLKPRKFLDLMLTRTFSWWMIFLVYLLFFCIDPRFAFLGLALLAGLAQDELLRHLESQGIPKVLRAWCGLVVAAQFIAIYFGGWIVPLLLIPMLHFLVISTYCLIFLKVEDLVKTSAIFLWTYFVSVYGIAHLAQMIQGFKLDLWGVTATGLFLYYLFLTQFNDVLQFIWGSLFGRRKIAPEISPKKTWEGLIGGVGSTMVIAVALRHLTPFSIAQAAILGCLLSLTGFYGDLLLSGFKRNLNIKDLGQFIPGHGGLLDRIDSLTLSSLVYYYLIYYWFMIPLK